MSATAKKQKERTEQVRQLEQRWTRALIAPGWTAVPSIILEKQHALGLDPLDLTIVLHLVMFWWYRDNPAHPSKGRIAAAIGIDASTVRRRIARMEKDGLIRREDRFDSSTGRQETNFYHFDGLIESTTPFAVEALREKEERKALSVARRKRKRPNIALVTRDSGDGK
jgi:DNA-binding MarR family transcriptional regulator